jgi:hypothetical protein
MTVMIIKLPEVKCRGQQGSWLVETELPGRGVLKLASAHNEFIRGVDLQYKRPDASTMMVPYAGKYAAWQEALLAHKMVVVTKDNRGRRIPAPRGLLGCLGNR